MIISIKKKRRRRRRRKISVGFPLVDLPDINVEKKNPKKYCILQWLPHAQKG